MAVTRIIKIHGSPDRSSVGILKDRIGYGLNPEKTNGNEFVSSYACEINTSASEFALSHSRYETITGRKNNNDVLAYQIRQSFKPGEVTPEEANKIGYELAERYLKGNFAFIVATHIDKAHIHNHIYFNSVSVDCDRKHRDRKGSAKDIARLSDLICIEHQLSTITFPQKRNSAYNNREGYTPYPSHRDLLRKDIDEVLETLPKDFDDFLDLMRGKGYEIRFGKHIAFKKPPQEKFIRLSSLGEGYLENDIRRTIAEKSIQIKKSKTSPAEKTSLLIDIQKKLDEGKGRGYANWAKVFNLKQMAKTVLFLQENDYENLEDLNLQISKISEETAKLKGEIKGSELRLAELSELKKNIICYAKTKEIFERYMASGYSKNYFKKHETEICLHRAAKKVFNNLGVKEIPTVKQINTEFNEVLQQKRKLYERFYFLKKKQRELLVHKSNIDLILGSQDSKQAKTVTIR